MREYRTRFLSTELLFGADLFPHKGGEDDNKDDNSNGNKEDNQSWEFLYGSWHGIRCWFQAHNRKADIRRAL